jgi:poly-gamma-glutamate capsule biosynthesis protein CapA/YwtB (metallophosphatase superfamily)
MLGRNVGERLGRPGTRLLAPELQEIVDGADLFLANLERCISDRGEPIRVPRKPFFFRAPPAAADWLAEIGVRWVTLANNHALDVGPEALMDTLDRSRAAGIAVVGAGGAEHRARVPAVLDTDGAACES